MPNETRDGLPSGPEDPPATDLPSLIQRGLGFHLQGHLAEARAIYEEVLRADPRHFDALNLLGTLALQSNDVSAAIDLIGKAIAVNPTYAPAHYNLGNAFRAANRPADAIASYKQAIALKPTLAEAHFNLGSLLLSLQRLDEALISLESALALNPDQDFLLGVVVHTRMRLCDWTDFAARRTHIKAEVDARKNASPPFPLLSLLDDPQTHRTAAEVYTAAKHPKSHALGPIAPRGPHDKIRIGYYSTNFYRHAVGSPVAELFEAHDKAKFEVFAFSLGADKQDSVRARISSAATKFFDVRTWSDRAVAQTSRDVGIDIAVDLSGHTQDARLGIFAAGCAPVQVSYFGYSAPTGADYIDYVIADETIIPPDRQADFTEKVVYLPHCFMVNDAHREVSEKAFTRRELGLPDTGFVFCSFSNSYKILPETFDIWMRLLKRVEGSTLWLLRDNAIAERNLRREAEARSVDGRRLVFAGRMPMEQHLARQRAADLFLDTFPYNAHTSGSDALRVGLPLLTLPGVSFAARVAASLLKTTGLPELVASSPEDYEAKALELATDRSKLRDLKRKLDANRLTSPLFNLPIFAREIEAAYTAIHGKQQAGLPPQGFKVGDAL